LRERSVEQDVGIGGEEAVESQAGGEEPTAHEVAGAAHGVERDRALRHGLRPGDLPSYALGCTIHAPLIAESHQGGRVGFPGDDDGEQPGARLLQQREGLRRIAAPRAARRGGDTNRLEQHGNGHHGHVERRDAVHGRRNERVARPESDPHHPQPPHVARGRDAKLPMFVGEIPSDRSSGRIQKQEHRSRDWLHARAVAYSAAQFLCDHGGRTRQP
jgi:hypothetical protein